MAQDIRDFQNELIEFYQKTKEKEKNGRPYTQGYIDALRYVIEWIDEFI